MGVHTERSSTTSRIDNRILSERNIAVIEILHNRLCFNFDRAFSKTTKHDIKKKKQDHIFCSLTQILANFFNKIIFTSYFITQEKQVS